MKKMSFVMAWFASTFALIIGVYIWIASWENGLDLFYYLGSIPYLSFIMGSLIIAIPMYGLVEAVIDDKWISNNL